VALSLGLWPEGSIVCTFCYSDLTLSSIQFVTF
jgi:hypothetical protein